MSEFILSDSNFIVKDEQDNVLLCANELDLYYLIALAVDAEENENIPQRQRFQQASEWINKEYDAKLTWGQVITIFNHIHEKVEDSKKKTTSMQESLNGTE